MKTVPNQQNRYQGWVVFSNDTDFWYLRFLKKGYRHCFVILNDGQNWVSFDPMAHYSEIIVHDVAADFDMPTWLSARGYEVIKSTQGSIPIKSSPPALLSCVESVKRVLGIHKFLIFTPWQLCKYLKRQSAQQHNLKSKFQHIHNEGEFQWEV